MTAGAPLPPPPPPSPTFRTTRCLSLRRTPCVSAVGVRARRDRTRQHHVRRVQLPAPRTRRPERRVDRRGWLVGRPDRYTCARAGGEGECVRGGLSVCRRVGCPSPCSHGGKSLYVCVNSLSCSPSPLALPIIHLPCPLLPHSSSLSSRSSTCTRTRTLPLLPCPRLALALARYHAVAPQAATRADQRTPQLSPSRATPSAGSPLCHTQYVARTLPSSSHHAVRSSHHPVRSPRYLPPSRR